MKVSFAKKHWIYLIFTIFIFENGFADVKDSKPLNTASLSYSKDTFDQGYDDWDFFSATVSRKFDFGSAAFRVNEANRFGLKGWQYEFDAYPSLRDGTYMYLNTGFSNSTSLFPKNRFGAEIYQSLPFSWEVSLGFRHLIFENSVVNIQTATVGKYIGNYFLTARVNNIPNSTGTSNSFSVQGRKYFGDEDYVALSYGSGRSLSQIGTSEDIAALSSRKFGLDSRFEVWPTWILNTGLSYESEEIRPSAFRIRKSFSIGIDKRF